MKLIKFKYFLLKCFLFSFFFLGSSTLIFADVFSTCRFHFGTDWEYAQNNSALLAQVDYLTGPWIGSAEHFNIGVYYEFCRDNNKVPVNHTYIIAFAARRDWNLQDCNVASPSLCERGAEYIRQNRQKIIDLYQTYAQGVYAIMGDRPSVWLMEADYTQYTLDEQDGGGLSFEEMGELMSDIIDVIKQHCPSARFSLDISPWRLRDWQIDWYGNMPMQDVSFIHTSGGQSRGDTEYISDDWNSECPTWKWTYDTFRKPILADAGYGVAGYSTGHDDQWDVVSNLNNRINDGVLGVSQVNPRSDWASIISNNRGALVEPPSCSGGDDGGGDNNGDQTCTPTTITPNIRVDDNQWQQTSSVTVAEGSTVRFGPQPSTGGSWSWSGPSGFSQSTREVTISNVQSHNQGEYTAIHTNSENCQSSQVFELNVCSPSQILPYIQVNGGNWQQTTDVTIQQGASVAIGPQPHGDENWIWSGCGTISGSREQFISPSQSCVAVGTYTNECGAESVESFNITVEQVTSVLNKKEIIENTFEIFPNPVTKGSLGIQLNKKHNSAMITIYDTSGREVYKRFVYAENGKIYLNTGLTEGIYIVSVKTKDTQFSRTITFVE